MAASSTVKTRGAAAAAASAAAGGPSEDGAPVRELFDQLARELNMDVSTAEIAWSSYEAIKQNYTLEGNQMHWLACALYVACRNSNLPTVGGTDASTTVEGNGVSLTRLLRSCKLSLIQFFNKVKKLADMSNLKPEFRETIELLERNFAVSNVIFKKYLPIFVDLFRDPSRDQPKVVRSRKQKKAPCTPSELFNFCWGLFVRVKADFPAISDDLVNSYHLLLSCVDYIFANAVLADRTDLLNEKFDPKEIREEAGGGGNLPCVLDKLIRAHDGIILEVKTIREQYWKPRIKMYFDRKLLKGEPEMSDKLCGILEPAYFEVNDKMIRRDYEAFVLGVGEYDERVFLDDEATDELGTPAKVDVTRQAFGGGGSSHAHRNLASQFDSSLSPLTPLSGSQYLKSKEQVRGTTPVSTATYQVSCLKNLLGKKGPEPSAKLADVVKSFDGGELEKMTGRVRELGDLFCRNYVAASENHPGSHDSFAKTRLQMGVTLYYKLLEKIVEGERSKNKPWSSLITNDFFHQALFACSLEIVIFSYNSQRTFPWILDTFSLEAINFYKVIEIIIRVEDSLARDVVKHLQRIEEQVLESRAWVAESSLWDLLERTGVPSCEDVSLPETTMVGLRADPSQSPLSHHGRAFSVMRSPVVGDRFKSPVVTAVARRQLDFDGGGSPVKAGQSLLASPQRIVGGGGGISIGVVGSAPGQQIVIAPPPEGRAVPERARKAGSLGLFFRKVYHLAHLRLDMLCHSLDVQEDNKRKIWTTFEHALREKTSLMKDRHLDQVLMCSLYIVLRVVDAKKNFTDVMKHYKNQPQAASHVYRSVLLRRRANAATGERAVQRHSLTTPPTPTRLAATSTIIDGEERGDLINFYNNVFMEQLQEFSLKFKSSCQTEGVPPLSPLPKLRAHPQSPCKKVSESHSVFIRTLKSNPDDKVILHNSPHKPLTYSFSRSPAKDLVKINELMRSEKSLVGKRLLQEEEPLPTTAATIPAARERYFIAGGREQGPPVKKMFVTSGAVNAKLGLILGDRSQTD